MAEFTFLEVHLDDATITNNAPYSGVEADETDETDGSGDRSVLGFGLVALVVLAAGAIAARALLGGEEPIPTPDEL